MDWQRQLGVNCYQRMQNSQSNNEEDGIIISSFNKVPKTPFKKKKKKSKSSVAFGIK